jgi:histidinol dehydrogenase
MSTHRSISCLRSREPRTWLARVQAAGAVFLGSWSPETMGDYCSGPNHTLPTYGYAKAYSGLSLEDFPEAHHGAGALALRVFAR